MKQFLTPHPSRKSYLQRLLLTVLTLFLAMGLGVAPAQATGVYDLPEIEAGAPTWIVDQADTISFANESALNNKFKKLAEKTGNEVRLVAIRRLDFGQTIDNFADQLFNKWFPTPEEQANQTLLVLDTLTNATALRQGEGVKSLLTDAIAESVVLETVAIPLRQGSKYNQAFLDAGERLVAVLSGKPDPGAPEAEKINIESTFASAEETDDRSATIWVILLLVVATVVPMVTYFWYVGLPGR
jgi:uncharacterized protein